MKEASFCQAWFAMNVYEIEPRYKAQVFPSFCFNCSFKCNIQWQAAVSPPQMESTEVITQEVLSL